MYREEQEALFRKRIKAPRKFIQVVVGPYFIGKTTMVQDQVAEAMLSQHYCTAQKAPDRSNEWVHEEWAKVRQIMRLDKISQIVLILDDIQYIDNWAEAVMEEWKVDTERELDIKVVVVGSSRILLSETLSEEFKQHAQVTELIALSFNEINEALGMNWSHYIYYGGYPESREQFRTPILWNIHTEHIMDQTIANDVFTTKRVLKKSVMSNLFCKACFHSGEIMSYYEMARKVGGVSNSSTIASYLQVLDESRLVCGLQMFGERQSYKSKPKWQVYDSVLMSMWRYGGFDTIYRAPVEWAQRVESAVGSYLVNNAKRLGYSVYYWKSGEEEVDFVVQKGERLIAIEVKSGRRKKSGFRAFRKLYHPDLELIVGSEEMSFERFLSMELEEL